MSTFSRKWCQLGPCLRGCRCFSSRQSLRWIFMVITDNQQMILRWWSTDTNWKCDNSLDDPDPGGRSLDYRITWVALPVLIVTEQEDLIQEHDQQMMINRWWAIYDRQMMINRWLAYDQQMIKRWWSTDDQQQCSSLLCVLYIVLWCSSLWSIQFLFLV